MIALMTCVVTRHSGCVKPTTSWSTASGGLTLQVSPSWPAVWDSWVKSMFRHQKECCQQAFSIYFFCVVLRLSSLQDLTSLDGTYDEEGGMGTDDSSSTGAR